jgi:hypothetical protein
MPYKLMITNQYIVWRGEPLEVDFYAFWRVRLVLHVTAKGIYIPGFCTLTYIYITYNQFNSFLYISYHFISLAYF